MAVLEIKKFNDKVLRKRCRKVKRVNKKIKKLIVDMAQTMEKEGGLGLAAPQVGELKRVIVVRAAVKGKRILGLINPKIKKKSREKEVNLEGCLSFPGIFLEIKRAREVVVEGLDYNGKKVRLKAKGLLARVFQHEIDHLNGILFFNRLGFFKKIRFKLKYPKIKL